MTVQSVDLRFYIQEIVKYENKKRHTHHIYCILITVLLFEPDTPHGFRERPEFTFWDFLGAVDSLHHNANGRSLVKCPTF